MQEHQPRQKPDVRLEHQPTQKQAVKVSFFVYPLEVVTKLLKLESRHHVFFLFLGYELYFSRSGNTNFLLKIDARKSAKTKTGCEIETSVETETSSNKYASSFIR